MIGVTRLYCGEEKASDPLRYGKATSVVEERVTPHRVWRSAAERRPVTVFNITQTCNLFCIHCYSDSENKKYKGELTTQECKDVLKDLGEFGVPSVLFSGGEPLMHPDIFELVEFANQQKLRSTLSTNGTLIDEKTAQRIKQTGFAYVGISLDGIGDTNDYFRGKKGAFRRAVDGFRNCKGVGQRVGLRLTLTQHNYKDLHKIFDFIEAENIDRACFYHLAYSGRGRHISTEDLTPEETRNALDSIMERTLDFKKRGLNKEILTVDNHVDGVYIYLKLKEQGDPRAEEVYEMLKWNGGGNYSSGVGVADIDFLGNVHPDQFWMTRTLGNVRERKFSDIWQDTSNPLLAGLRNRAPLLKGRCGKCKFKALCGGSLRVRAEAAFGDPFAPDPACYLSDDEIGLTENDKTELKAKGEWYDVPVSTGQTPPPAQHPDPNSRLLRRAKGGTLEETPASPATGNNQQLVALKGESAMGAEAAEPGAPADC